MNKDEQRHYDEIKEMLKLPEKNHTDWSYEKWIEGENYRRECLVEYLATLETGSTDHIQIERKRSDDNPKVNHFK